MPSTTTQTTKDPTLMQAMERLGEQLAAIGVSLSLFDQSHAPLMQPRNESEFCQRLDQSAGPCVKARGSVVERVWSAGEPVIEQTALGCVLIGLPVMRRRRVTAVALASYVSSEMVDGEALARVCDQLHLDRTYMEGLARTHTLHTAAEAQHLQMLLEGMIARELDNAVAQQELVTLSTNLSTTYEELSLLYSLSASMRVNTTPEEFFQGVCEELLEVMQVAAAVTILYSPARGEDNALVVRAGQIDLTDQQLRALAERHIAPRLDETARSHVANALDGRQYGPEVRNLIAAPLAAGEETHGLLLGLNKINGEFDSVDLKLIKSVGNQAAVFMANSHLYEELQELLMGVLHVLTASIDAKDQYTCGHSQRVALISRTLAQKCGFEPEKVRRIYLAGLLHDIGKIGVPEQVLCKAGKLTDEEFTRMKRHPVIGAKILSNIRQMQDVIPGVLHHHERIDGRGYPDGLAGEEIPIEGRIVGLADCFDAMTSSRTYRRELPLETVLAEIMRCAGTQFDSKLVDHLLELDLPEFLRKIREGEPATVAIRGAIRSEPA